MRFLYAVLAYTAFVISGAWAMRFLAVTVDGPARHTAPVALAIDGTLLLVFAAHHSIAARGRFKRHIPASIERSTYVLVASLLLFAVLGWWEPVRRSLVASALTSWQPAPRQGVATTCDAHRGPNRSALFGQNQSVDWDELLWHTERRLGIYVGLPRYDRACSLLTGFDLARSRGDLARFQTWMAERYDGSPVVWSWLILRETFGTGAGEQSLVTDDDHQVAIKNLCLRLREFLNLPTDDSRVQEPRLSA